MDPMITDVLEGVFFLDIQCELNEECLYENLDYIDFINKED